MSRSKRKSCEEQLCSRQVPLSMRECGRVALQRGISAVKRILQASVGILALAIDVQSAEAADQPVKKVRPLVTKAMPPSPPPPIWSWAGFYAGAQSGVARGIARFSDPFGVPIFGDIVGSPS